MKTKPPESSEPTGYERENPLTTSVTENLLQRAEELVYGDRNEVYGHPLDDFSRQAALLNILFDKKLKVLFSAEDIPLLMLAVKMSRLTETPNHYDTWVDVAGYAGTWDRVNRGKNGSDPS